MNEKSSVKKSTEQSHNIIKKGLENEILPKFTSINFTFGVSIVVSFSYHKIKSIH